MPQSDRNVQDPDRQTQLHAITDRLADDLAGVQIKDDGEIQPVFTGPNVAYITSLFLVRAIRSEVLIQQVGRDVGRVIAIHRRLVFPADKLH